MLKGHLAVALLAAVDDVPGGGDDDEEGNEENGGFHVEAGFGFDWKRNVKSVTGQYSYPQPSDLIAD